MNCKSLYYLQFSEDLFDFKFLFHKVLLLKSANDRHQKKIFKAKKILFCARREFGSQETWRESRCRNCMCESEESDVNVAHLHDRVTSNRLKSLWH